MYDTLQIQSHASMHYTDTSFSYSGGGGIWNPLSVAIALMNQMMKVSKSHLY